MTRSEADSPRPLLATMGISPPSNPEPINRAAASGLPVSCLGLFNAAACNVPHLVQFPVRAAPVLVKANVLCLFIAHRRHQVYCGALLRFPHFLTAATVQILHVRGKNVKLLVATW